MKKILISPYTYIGLVFIIFILMAISNTYAWFNWQSVDDLRFEVKIGKVTPPVFDGIVNKPNLHDGMIPIKYNGSDWVKADVTNASNDWYDYNNKKWANAVMVKETGTKTRVQYMSDPTNTVIQKADILAYFVWIPRYKYQLFNVEFASITWKEIKIEFEEGTSTTGSVSCSTSNLGVETCINKANGNWYTHPAFTFGDEELTGIWVGKFETTGDATTPTIKNGGQSITNQNVNTQFAIAQKFNSTIYVTSDGLTVIDAHMMKNVEWGAVGYFTQSKYGRCTSGSCSEISINNSSYHYVGSSSGSPGYENTPTSIYGTYSYNHVQGITASTTGNIYGIYDMSGGAWEFTMGIMSDNVGNLMYSTSGFNIDNMPNKKYYDKYAYGVSYNNQTAYNRSHLGDAMGETINWYSDKTSFVYYHDSYNVFSWFTRGGYFSDRYIAGIFNFDNYYGNGDWNIGFRVVIS